MILQLNSEQTLALFKLITIATSKPDVYLEGTTHLEEVKEKLQSVIIESLDNMYISSNSTKFSSWIKNEQDRIDELTRKLETIKDSFQQDDGLHFPPQKPNDVGTNPEPLI